MIDAFEQKFGPVEDRSIFDGEIVVPPHLRNMSLTSIRANRFANGSIFGSVPRSRTLFTLPPNARHTFHGSVPDLSRHSSPFTFNNNNNNNTLNNNATTHGDDGRQLSSASTIPGTITTITLNTSTTLELTNNKNRMKNASSNGNAVHAMESIEDDGDGFDYRSNSIRSLNDIQLREKIGMEQHRALYCQSLGRPNRTQKVSNQQRLRSQQPQSLDAYSSEGYMTLIKTNVAPSSHGRYHQRSSLINRATSPATMPMNADDQIINQTNSQMATSTSTFQRNAAAAVTPIAPILIPPPPPSKIQQTAHRSHPLNQPPPRSSGAFANEFNLNNLTKFKLPRVTLNHSAVTNPQQ